MTDRIVDFRLADAEARHRESPRSFFIPARAEREALQPGELAKLLFEIVDPDGDMPGGERMWVGVTERNEEVRFGPEHVISTVENWPLLEREVLVSRRSHVDEQRPAWVYREDPETEKDSGWRALVGDESDEEVDDPANVLSQMVGYLLDRWSDLRPVFKTDPENGSWTWDAMSEKYLRTAEDS